MSVRTATHGARCWTTCDPINAPWQIQPLMQPAPMYADLARGGSAHIRNDGCVGAQNTCRTECSCNGQFYVRLSVRERACKRRV